MPTLRLPCAMLLVVALFAAGCAKSDPDLNAQALANAPAAATPTPTPSATPTATVPAGFDPATAPQGSSPSGAFPYFGLMDGYRQAKREEASYYDTEYQRDVNYDQYQVFDGSRLLTIEGRLRTIKGIGRGRSFFEAMKNYETLIRNLGGVTVFEGTAARFKELKLSWPAGAPGQRDDWADSRMGVYMVRTPTNQIWVEVFQPHGEAADNYWLTVVETKKLDVSAQVVPAAALKQALDANGHVAVYVNFATDQTAVLPTSQPAIAEVVKLLTADPALKLTIEGHTDNAGTPAHNQTLSQGRANAVMGMLIAQGIDPARLQAKGLGQTKPIADNGAEDGRAKNRRVELVRR